MCNNGTFLFLLQIGGHMSKEGGGCQMSYFFKSIYLYISWFEQKFIVFSLFFKILHYQGHKFCSREEFQVHTDVV